MFQNEAIFLDPPLWGTHFWVSIESIIIAMDTTEKNSIDSVYLFLMSLQNTLPCPTCRLHYQNYCSRFDLKKYIHNKQLLFKWLYNLQKEIQTRNNKSMISYEIYIQTIKSKFNLH